MNFDEIPSLESFYGGFACGTLGCDQHAQHKASSIPQASQVLIRTPGFQVANPHRLEAQSGAKKPLPPRERKRRLSPPRTPIPDAVVVLDDNFEEVKQGGSYWQSTAVDNCKRKKCTGKNAPVIFKLGHVLQVKPVSSMNLIVYLKDNDVATYEVGSGGFRKMPRENCCRIANRYPKRFLVQTLVNWDAEKDRVKKLGTGESVSMEFFYQPHVLLPPVPYSPESNQLILQHWGKEPAIFLEKEQHSLILVEIFALGAVPNITSGPLRWFPVTGQVVRRSADGQTTMENIMELPCVPIPRKVVKEMIEEDMQELAEENAESAFEFDEVHSALFHRDDFNPFDNNPNWCPYDFN